MPKPEPAPNDWGARAQDAPPMSSGALEMLFCGLLRFPSVLGSARTSIKFPHFYDEGEAKLRLLWTAIKELADAGETLAFANVAHRVRELYAADDGGCNADDIADLTEDPRRRKSTGSGLIYHAFHEMTDADLTLERSFDLLKRFLHERGVYRPIQDYVNSSSGFVPGNLSMLLDAARGVHAAADALGEDPAINFLECDDDDPVLDIPLGVPAFDHLLGGGMAGGEIALITGVTGCGKTTAACQIVCEKSLWLWQQPGPPKYAYLFSYEDGRKLLRPRVVAYAARIQRNRVESLGRIQNFSTTATMEAYERELRFTQGEQERYAEFMPRYTSRLVVVDCQDGAFGSGGVPEIAAYLDRNARSGKPPGLVIVDWAGEVASRFLSAAGNSRDMQRDLSFMLNEMPGTLRRTVAQPFNVPVVLLHQFTASVMNRGPLARLHHVDGMYAKHMGVRSDYALSLNPPDEETRIMQATTVKSRRKGLEGRTTLIRLRGEFAQFDRVDDLYSVDVGRNTFVERRAIDSIQGEAIKTPTRSPRRRIGLRTRSPMDTLE